MAQCKDCIHYCVCDRYTAPNKSYPEVVGCKLFKNIADVVSKNSLTQSQRLLKDAWGRIEELGELCDEWHRTAELNAQRIIELEAELSDAKSESAREIFEEIEKIICDTDDECYEKYEYESRWGAGEAIGIIDIAITKLKRKCVGEQNDGR